jgi:plastocyanin
MRVQDYAPPKLTLGIVGVVAVIIPILVGYFLVTGLGSNVSYTFPGGATSTTATTSTGAGSAVVISLPSGSGSPSGAPGFAPDKVTVVIGVNSTVTWTNNDNAAHTVTSTNLTSGTPSFDSGNMAAGQSFTYNFTQPGTYGYKCNYHAWMTGSVVVKKGTEAVKVSMPSGAGNPSGAPGYAPAKITLVLGVNSTVTWTNDDSAAHTVTSTSVPTGAASFDSGNMSPGAAFTYTFTVAGTYQYHCSYHNWMTATVTVVQG